jgi:PPM family protein phosphatase
MATIEAFGKTDTGLVRPNNEDAWSFEPSLHLAMVADGMGGAACGEVASRMTIDSVVEFLRDAHGEDSRGKAVRLVEAIREANRRVIERTRQEQGCRGMGSTVVAAYWDLPHVLIVNVGDSRAYLFRQGKLDQLSYDQTVVNELRRRMELTEAQVEQFPYRNALTMAIGSTDDVMICTRELELQPGDELLLCSDGLTGPVSDERIAAILGGEEGLETRVAHLVQEAKHGGGPDNITVILLSYRGEQ